MPPPSGAAAPAPAWYPDPSNPAMLRWYDGVQFTDHVAPAGQPPRAPSLGDDAGMRMLLPVGRSGWAIAAGYLGLFSLVLIGAPFALVVGAIAAWDLSKHPEKHGWGRTIFGLLAGSIGTVALVVLALS